MKKLFGVLIFAVGFLAATYAMAQVYNDKHDAMLEPMERVVHEHDTVFGNVGEPGASEDAQSQHERYDNMMAPMDNIVDQHFNTVAHEPDIEETPAAQ